MLTIRAELRHTPTIPSDCAAIVGDMLLLYWDKDLDEDSSKRQLAIWFTTLKNHSSATIQAACLEWVAKDRRTPTPHDILALCNDNDRTPERMARIELLLGLPILLPQKDVDDAADKFSLIGDPIVLGRMIGAAKASDIDFTDDQQMHYLRTGERPNWYLPNEIIAEAPPAPVGPTREEILAGMTEEERRAAIGL